jgi:hypothetical protein
MVTFFQSLFVWALLILLGVAFCDIVSTDGWQSGFLFLLILPVFLAVLLVPFTLLSDVSRHFRKR